MASGALRKHEQPVLRETDPQLSLCLPDATLGTGRHRATDPTDRAYFAKKIEAEFDRMIVTVAQPQQQRNTV
jgi:hypothetical protein